MATAKAQSIKKSLQTTLAPKAEHVKEAIGPKAELVKQSVCSRRFLIEGMKTMGLVLFYYVFSISLTFYNQRFIHHFKFPLSITLVHLTTKFMMAAVIRWILECKTGKQRVMLEWGPFTKKVAPPGIAASLDIGLSNWSFEFITISLYTMTKSTVIVFILLFSVIFRLEKPRCSLVFPVLFISGGLFLFTFQSTQFNMLGFCLVLGASFLSGIRWTLAQVVLQKSDLGLSNPLDFMYHIQPWMALALFPLAAGFESLHVATTKDVFAYQDVYVLLQNLALLMAGAIVAFCMEFAEFLLLARTSGITLSISGIFKEICTLILAAAINGDRISPINGIGLLVCLLGILSHVIIKAIAGNQTPEKERSEDRGAALIKNGIANIDSEEDEGEEIELFDVRKR